MNDDLIQERSSKFLTWTVDLWCPSLKLYNLIMNDNKLLAISPTLPELKATFFAYLPSSWYCLSPLCLLGKIMLCSMYVYVYTVTTPNLMLKIHATLFYLYSWRKEAIFFASLFSTVSRILSCKMGQRKPVNTVWTWCYINVKLNIPYNWRN